MSRVKLSMPSPAMVVACLALIAALGGTAYAALSKNSVKAKQIAPKAVGTSELAKAAVKGSKIADGAISEAKLLDDAVTKAKIGNDAVGTEELGPLAVKLADLGVVVNSRFVDAPLPDDGSKVNVNAECPAGQVAISGGYSFALAVPGPPAPDDFTGDFHVIQSRPNINPGAGFPDQGSGFNSWRVTGVNEAGGNTPAAQLTAMVVCLRDL